MQSCSTSRAALFAELFYIIYAEMLYMQKKEKDAQVGLLHVHPFCHLVTALKILTSKCVQITLVSVSKLILFSMCHTMRPTRLTPADSQTTYVQ